MISICPEHLPAASVFDASWLGKLAFCKIKKEASRRHA